MAPSSDKFQIYAPIRAFDNAAKGKEHRRIAGIISTESIDRQGEAVLQRGMNFADFLKNGWYNDNHSQGTTDILGYPDSVTSFRRGDVLPDGTTAKSNLTWTEGYLLDGYGPADKIWDLANALKGTPRSLGFSIEGKILQREGPGSRVIGKADINHVAITACPVNVDTRLQTLVRSMQAIEEQAAKAMTMGNPMGGGICPIDVVNGGAGPGTVLARESLSRRITNLAKDEDDEDERNRKKRKAELTEKSFSDRQALEWIFRSRPDASIDYALLLLKTAKHMWRRTHG